ncbi:Iron-sulfur protein [Corynebacterium pseudotuberculosis]|nr:Iron-sulfur protein [Corynebacterium pseudotuberculosis]
MTASRFRCNTGFMTTHDSTSSASQGPRCTRRMFLLGTATTFAGAVLAACGGDKTKAKEIALSDVPVGGATIVDDFIIAQPAAGEYKAYSTDCPHQHAKITIVQGDTVKCPKHGSIFNIKDGGVVQGPSKDPLVAKPLEVSGDKAKIS